MILLQTGDVALNHYRNKNIISGGQAIYNQNKISENLTSVCICIKFIYENVHYFCKYINPKLRQLFDQY